MNINDHIVYVKIDENKKIELTKDRLDINQTLDYMYIAWFWIKYNSFKTIDHTWKNHKNNQSEELIGSSIYQCNLLFDVVTGFMSACYLFVIDKVKNLVDQFGIAKENEKYYASFYDGYIKINSDDIVIRYGTTNNLKHRINDHSIRYGPQIRFICTQIEPDFIFAARKDIKSYFMKEKRHLYVNEHNKMAIINTNNIENIKKLFITINKKYRNEMITNNLQTQ